MKLITRYDLAQQAPARWIEAHKNDTYDRWHAVTRGMEKLIGTVVNPDEIDAMIGNTSWTTPSSCSDCNKHGDEVMQMGQEPDYESYTAYLCLECLQKATAIMAAE